MKNTQAVPQPLVSIIVPCYKVEDFIVECLDSIAKQTYSNFECVVVDDGSPDQSGEIAEKFAAQDNRFKVMHQQNGGISVARNTGYDATKGEFVCFVDSDDYWMPDYLAYFVKMITDTNTDIALSLNYFGLRHSEQIENDKIELVSSEKTLKNIFYLILHMGVWNKIYRRSYLEKHNLRHFPPLNFGEGMTFNIYALQHTKEVAVGLRRVYHYRYNFDSATRKFTWDDRRRSGFTAFEYMEKAIADNSDAVKRAFDCHVWWSNYWICFGIVKAQQLREYKALYKQFRTNIRRTIKAPLVSDDLLIKKIFALATYFSPFLTSTFLTLREKAFITRFQKKKG